MTDKEIDAQFRNYRKLFAYVCDTVEQGYSRVLDEQSAWLEGERTICNSERLLQSRV